ncbi:MAG: pimeloyl-ACP methyl esterase BioG family protein [Cognatishimia sp.]
MQISWLRKNDAETLIVIFGGWALGAEPFLHLSGDADLLFVQDFRSFTALPDLSGYTTKTLVAYSLGVASFGHWQAQFSADFTRKIAVNGSLYPVDRKRGIPPAVFDKTNDGLSTASYQEFRSHCYNAAQPAQDIDVTARQAELAAVKQRGAAPEVHFDRIWISTRDRIFPAPNLRRAWSGQTDVVRETSAPHVPFTQWQSWAEVTA